MHNKHLSHLVAKSMNELAHKSPLITIDMNQIILTQKKECVVEGNILVLSPEGLVVWIKPPLNPSGISSLPSFKFGFLRPHILSEFLVVFPSGGYLSTYFLELHNTIAKDLC